MRLIGFAAFFAGLMTMTAAYAQRAVASGGQIQIVSFVSLDQACHSNGLPAVNLLARPYGGVVAIKTAYGYSNFPSWNTRSRCNAMKVPQTRVLYQSTPGFRGSDHVEFEVIFPVTGVVRRFDVPISVR